MMRESKTDDIIIIDAIAIERFIDTFGSGFIWGAVMENLSYLNDRMRFLRKKKPAKQS